MEELIKILQERLSFYEDEQQVQQRRVDFYTNRLEELCICKEEMHPIIFKCKERHLLKSREVMEIWKEYNKNEISELEAELAEINKEKTTNL